MITYTSSLVLCMGLSGIALVAMSMVLLVGYQTAGYAQASS
jgi:hypothetical protein